MQLKNPAERFDEFYRIYEESFPLIERRAREGQKEVLQNPLYQVKVIEENKKILAFLGYWDLPGCVFLEHLATAEACRGKGYGRELVLECIADTKKPLFLEIEPITESDSMTGRRAGFYERLDFFVNRFPYKQMPLKQGDAPIDLWVMSYKTSIEETEFLPYKNEIYEIVYKVGNQNNI